MVYVTTDAMMGGPEKTVQKNVQQANLDQTVGTTAVVTVLVTFRVIEPPGGATLAVNLDTLESCVKKVAKMKCMAKTVSLHAVEIASITFLAIQPMDIVIVDVPPDI